VYVFLQINIAQESKFLRNFIKFCFIQKRHGALMDTKWT